MWQSEDTDKSEQIVIESVGTQHPTKRSRARLWALKKTGLNHVGILSKSVYGGFRTLYRESKRPKAPESFENAMARQGIGDDDVARIYSRIRASFFTSAVLMLICAAASLYTAITSYGFMGAFPMSTLVAVSFMAWTGTRTFEASFRAWQIRHRYLGSIGEFIDSGEIIPVRVSP